MYCMECGAEIAAETKFCGKCGAGQTVVESPTKAININHGDPKAGQKILMPQYTEPQASTSAPRSNVVIYAVVGVLVFAVAGGVGYWGWTQARAKVAQPVQTVVSSNPVAEWVEVHKDDEVSALYAKPSSIHRIGDKVEIWFLEDMITAETLSGDEYFTEMKHIEFDCSEAQSRKLGVKVFSGHMGSGNILYNDPDIQEWKPVAPNTIWYEGLKFACKEQSQREVSSTSAAPRGNSFMDKAANTVANDQVEKYEIAKRNGKPVDICVQAMMVSAVYLQAKDESNYQRWKQTQSADCARAGMPQ